MQDAREKSTLEDNSIDLVVTSPPYANSMIMRMQLD